MVKADLGRAQYLLLLLDRARSELRSVRKVVTPITLDLPDIDESSLRSAGRSRLNSEAPRLGG